MQKKIRIKLSLKKADLIVQQSDRMLQSSKSSNKIQVHLSITSSPFIYFYYILFIINYQTSVVFQIERESSPLSKLINNNKKGKCN